MNILIVSQYFSPENFRINDLADELNHRGNNITVLTNVPNYPHGKYFDGYGIFKKNKENINNINIIRSPIIPRGSGSGIRLTLNYLSFVFGAIFSSLQLINKKFDVIFVFEPSPITVCLPAIFIKKIKKIPICLWVLDLWPESVVSANNLNTKFVPSLLNPLVKYIYNKSDKILVSSKGFIDSIKKRGISKNKIIYFPQWAEEIFKPLIPKQKLLEKIPNHSFKIMFAGNIGEAQDFGCEILDSRGNQIAHSPRAMPVFNLTLPIAVKAMIDSFPTQTLKKGDILITNDPWLCAGHAYDIAVAAPVFNNNRVVAFVGVVGHVSDIGGTLNHLKAQELYEEGLQIPPMKLFNEGNPRTTSADRNFRSQSKRTTRR